MEIAILIVLWILGFLLVTYSFCWVWHSVIRNQAIKSVEAFIDWEESHPEIPTTHPKAQEFLRAAVKAYRDFLAVTPDFDKTGEHLKKLEDKIIELPK
ncbi:MAG: hypothetical protein HYS78_00035 [Parcubacteria group bacterium]|nr:hypothetical protein [Parcubacteria group bacterium]